MLYTKTYTEVFKSPIRNIHCTFKGQYLIKLTISKYMEDPRQSDILGNSFIIENFQEELKGYFNGALQEFKQKIKIISSTFDKKVWLTLKKIPFGQTRSYKWVAQKIGCPSSARAIGQSLKRNPIPIILPCHRVINSDGSIGGFSSGIEIKKMLLIHEIENIPCIK